MVKARRGLLLSLLTLIIALGVTVTSTFAWFVVNREVTASNMQVTVKSDTTYLVISDTSTLGTDLTKAMSASSAQVLPVRYNEEGTGATKWEYTSGAAYDDGTKNNEASWNVVSTTDLDKYTVKYTFYVGLTNTTALPATNLRVKSMTVQAATEGGDETFMPAVSAMVQCGSNTPVDFENISGIDAAGYTAKSDLFAGPVAIGTAYQIDVYVYINGDHSAVKSSNTAPAKLGSFKLSMTLEVTPGTEA